MQIIHSSAELGDQPPDPELAELLGAYAAALEDFGDDLAAIILIIQAGDTLAQAEQAYGARLVVDGRFTFTVETISEQRGWYDVTWIQSDDGSGLVLLIEKDGDGQLMAACRAALADNVHPF